MEALYNYFASGVLYIQQHWDRVQPHFIGHLQIVGITLLVSVIIALPLGYAISRSRALATPVLGVLGVLYTIPSLAFLAILIPFTGLDQLTTIIVLVTYAQAILVRNVMLGFTGVDRSILEAARGVGMSRSQVLWQVELPLALPVIIAGLRIVTLATISIATIGAYAGAESLGVLLKVNNDRLRAAGIICVVALALAADLLYRLLERSTSSHRRVRAATVPTGAKEA